MSDAFEKVTYNGRLMDKKTRAFVMAMEEKLGYSLTILQGSYNAGVVSVSAGTHDGGGVIDLAPYDAARKVRVARELGAFAWHRETLPGKWSEHVHLGIRNHGRLSSEARDQQEDYDAKPPRNGLVGHAVDPTWHPNPPVTFVYPPKVAPVPTPAKLIDFMHASLDFRDTPGQMRHDVSTIFDRCKRRGVKVLTGTEAGPGAEPLADLLVSNAERCGYRLYHPRMTDSWIAVDKTFVNGKWRGEYDEVFTGVARKHTSRGLVTVSFLNDKLGEINIGTSHYLTKGAQPGDPFYDENTELAEVIGRWAKKAGAGPALCFYAGDQNIPDRSNDTFRGQPLVSSWDELGKWEPTHGRVTIDVIASYAKDGRVEARYARALDDKDLQLYTDHYPVESGFNVEYSKEAS